MTNRGKLVGAVIEGFKTLSNCQFGNSADLVKISATAEDLLFAVYKAGVSGVAYTAEEKQILGPLVPPALQALGHRVFTLQNSFSANSVDSTRIERSGLQFFLDIFKEFPSKTGNQSENLEDTLKEFVDREDIQGLDELLKDPVFDPYTDDSERSPDFEAEIAKLPSTHWWFSD